MVDYKCAGNSLFYTNTCVIKNLPPEETEKSKIPAQELDKDSKGKLPISSVVQALQLLDQAPTEKVVREIVKKQKLDGGSDGSELV
ncbi:Calmodulin-like protein [Taenia solium]|eukprot:TsM_000777700 transcript=TsM_000777700 gene=TsM_000777700